MQKLREEPRQPEAPAPDSSSYATLPVARVPELDGLRGIAIALVLLWHFAVAGNPLIETFLPASVAPLLRLSWSGVQLFFVLSGYLIGGILIDSRSNSRYFSSFYIRRVFRILPLYFLYLGLFTIGTLCFEHGHLQRYFELFAHRGPLTPFVILIQNIWMTWSGRWGCSGLSVTWSLAVEEHFYLILPLLTGLLSLRWMIRAVIAGIFAAPFIRLGLMLWWPKGELAAYWLMPCHADSLGLGVLIAWMIRTPSIFERVRKYPHICRSISVILFLAVWGVAQINPQVGSWPITTVGYSLLAALYASILMYVAFFRSSLLRDICRIRPLRFCGLIAYGLYLFHLPIDIIIHGFVFGRPPRFTDIPSIVASIFALALSFGFATLTWRYIEQPFIRFARRATNH